MAGYQRTRWPLRCSATTPKATGNSLLADNNTHWHTYTHVCKPTQPNIHTRAYIHITQTQTQAQEHTDTSTHTNTDAYTLHYLEMLWNVKQKTEEVCFSITPSVIEPDILTSMRRNAFNPADDKVRSPCVTFPTAHSQIRHCPPYTHIKLYSRVLS